MLGFFSGDSGHLHHKLRSGFLQVALVRQRRHSGHHLDLPLLVNPEPYPILLHQSAYEATYPVDEDLVVEDDDRTPLHVGLNRDLLENLLELRLLIGL